MKLAKSKYYIFIIILSVVVFSPTLESSNASEREKTVCGFLKERLLFQFWSWATPKPDSSRVSNLPNVESISFKTSDNKTLYGYKYLSHDENNQRTEPKGYVLMAIGNAMLSDQIIRCLKSFAADSYDVYIYDYRGYGNSEGSRRINAIIEDYKEIVASLNKKYNKKLLYGISFGGIVILNVIGGGFDFDAAVIDSTPSYLSSYGCPKTIDSIEHLPDDSSKLLVITGDNDKVLNNDMTKDLRETAKMKGAKIIKGVTFSHPFMDKSREIHLERMKIIRDFLFNK